MPDESYDERFKDIHHTNNTEAMKKKYPEKYPRKDADDFEIRFKERRRAEMSDPPERSYRNLEKKMICTQASDDAAKNREDNKVAGRDFAYAKDNEKHWSSRS